MCKRSFTSQMFLSQEYWTVIWIYLAMLHRCYCHYYCFIQNINCFNFCYWKYKLPLYAQMYTYNLYPINWNSLFWSGHFQQQYRGCAFILQSSRNKGIEQACYTVSRTIQDNTVPEPWILFLYIALPTWVGSYKLTSDCIEQSLGLRYSSSYAQPVIGCAGNYPCRVSQRK